jgi:hypothetical protein
VRVATTDVVDDDDDEKEQHARVRALVNVKVRSKMSP